MTSEALEVISSAERAHKLARQLLLTLATHALLAAGPPIFRASLPCSLRETVGTPISSAPLSLLRRRPRGLQGAIGKQGGVVLG